MTHQELYRHARYYDVAFSYRDVVGEVDFFLACARLAAADVKTALELASGPGAHARELARRGIPSVALDLSAPMVALCLEKAAAEQLAVEGVVADMRTFTVKRPVDLALNLLTSISYLLEPADLRAHFAAVHAALAPGGVYIVENNHPRDFWSGDHFRPSIWTSREGDLAVEARWHTNAPRVDWNRQRYEIACTFVVDDHGERVELGDSGWLRMTFPSELQGHAEVVGLSLIGIFGSFDLARPLDDLPDAWRTLAVFQRPPARANAARATRSGSGTTP
jgi:SAM-dependent methyltransferase